MPPVEIIGREYMMSQEEGRRLAEQLPPLLSEELTTAAHRFEPNDFRAIELKLWHDYYRFLDSRGRNLIIRVRYLPEDHDYRKGISSRAFRVAERIRPLINRDRFVDGKGLPGVDLVCGEDVSTKNNEGFVLIA